MSKTRPNGNAPTPPARDIVREARRLSRLQRLRLVVNEPEVDRARPAPPKEAA